MLGALIGTMVGGAGSDWLLSRGVATSIGRKSPIITGLISSMIIIFTQGMTSVTARTLMSDIAPANQIALTGGLSGQPRCAWASIM